MRFLGLLAICLCVAFSATVSATPSQTDATSTFVSNLGKAQRSRQWAQACVPAHQPCDENNKCCAGLSCKIAGTARTCDEDN